MVPSPQLECLNTAAPQPAGAAAAPGSYPSPSRGANAAQRAAYAAGAALARQGVQHG
jgi:hypothetical protein